MSLIFFLSHASPSSYIHIVCLSFDSWIACEWRRIALCNLLDFPSSTFLLPPSQFSSHHPPPSSFLRDCQEAQKDNNKEAFIVTMFCRIHSYQIVMSNFFPILRLIKSFAIKLLFYYFCFVTTSPPLENLIWNRGKFLLNLKSRDHVKDFIFNSRVMMTQSRAGWVCLYANWVFNSTAPRSRNEFQI